VVPLRDRRLADSYRRRHVACRSVTRAVPQALTLTWRCKPREQLSSQASVVLLDQLPGGRGRCTAPERTRRHQLVGGLLADGFTRVVPLQGRKRFGAASRRECGT
jgi:hypothetical protein